jgi:hypothetical protein
MLYIKENVVNHIKECIKTLKIKEDANTLEDVRKAIVAIFDASCGEKRQEKLYIALNETELFIMVDELRICSVIGGGVPTTVVSDFGIEKVDWSKHQFLYLGELFENTYVCKNIEELLIHMFEDFSAILRVNFVRKFTPDE